MSLFNFQEKGISNLLSNTHVGVLPKMLSNYKYKISSLNIKVSDFHRECNILRYKVK